MSSWSSSLAAGSPSQIQRLRPAHTPTTAEWHAQQARQARSRKGLGRTRIGAGSFAELIECGPVHPRSASESSVVSCDDEPASVANAPSGYTGHQCSVSIASGDSVAHPEREELRWES